MFLMLLIFTCTPISRSVLGWTVNQLSEPKTVATTVKYNNTTISISANTNDYLDEVISVHTKKDVGNDKEFWSDYEATTSAYNQTFCAKNISCIDYDAVKGFLRDNEDNMTIPTKFDWRHTKLIKGVVAKPKDRGDCNAAWAFAIVATIQSHIKIQYGLIEVLSEQYLIDCIPKSTGCNPDSLLKITCYMVTVLGGVLRAEDYPYSGKREQCAVPLSMPTRPQPVSVFGFRRVKPNETAMVEALVRNGPLIAAMHDYPILNPTEPLKIYQPQPGECKTEPSEMNYAVMIVGYSAYVNSTTKEETPYWVLQNSQGVGFGSKGYFFLVRNRNACGIANDVLFPYVT